MIASEREFRYPSFRLPMNSATAGRHDPYWYESYVGLIEVIEMLDPASGIESVAFQVSGIKGWDDVVVRLADGRRYYQVKHTRSRNSLTFGDLIIEVEGDESLLGSLFTAWGTANLNDGKTACILYTNREAGQRGNSPADGFYRPPLLEFEQWLRANAGTVDSLDELIPQKKWQPAWRAWLSKLRGKNVNDGDRLAFLRALQIRASEDDLDGIEQRIRDKLALAFGVPTARVEPFVDALHRALRDWTTGHPPVTPEQVFSKFALRAEPAELAPAPPPPEPFFPSREPMVGELENLILAKDTPPVVFLGAEPGAGKTSLLSRLANRRVDVPLSGLIGLRYFCFEPIRPETPVIAPDAGRVHPRNLWLSLLAQLRDGLRGRLRELRVPLRNDLLTWQEARGHVLRLAATMGGELPRPFVIMIDGIDHAARAAQLGNEQATEFFASLPGPDEFAQMPVRLLIAGQPPEQYPRYPAWLHGEHPRVRKVSLSNLGTPDVRALYQAEKSNLPAQQTEQAVRLIETHARGNTLATVFAVAEAASVTTLADFATRLEQRRLRDGLEIYYAEIWQHALATAGDQALAADSCLTGALCLAREGVTVEMLASAFASWERPAPWWRHLLALLGPLLVEATDGFRVRHNDVRLFLAARFAAHGASERRSVASQLADYYLQSPAPRAAAHRALFPLLHLAARPAETARVFDVEWVCEGAALGIEIEQLIDESKVAARALPEFREWDAVLGLACAIQTLERWYEQRDEMRQSTAVGSAADVPPFLPSEASVHPRNLWTMESLAALVADATQLTAAGMLARAAGLLTRWLHGMDIPTLVAAIPGAVTEEEWGTPKQRLQSGLDQHFATLGRLSCNLDWPFLIGKPGSQPEHHAGIAFERGYIEAACTYSNAQSLDEWFGVQVPYYLVSWQLAVEKLVQIERWELVRAALQELGKHREKLSSVFRAEAVWWALRSGAVAQSSGWLMALNQPAYGLKAGSETPISAFLAVARARGWEEIATEPADIADGIYAAYDPEGRHEETAPLARLLFRGAAFIGRVRGVASRRDWATAAEVVGPRQAEDLLARLWSRDIIESARFRHGPSASGLAAELGEICLTLGGVFSEAALKAALPYAAKFPMDNRRPGLWRVVAFHGQRELLLAWLRHWLNEHGEAWQSGPSERADIVQELVPLARELGEHHLGDTALERLRFSQVGYRSEERIFAGAVRWLRALCIREPDAWQHEGWKLWSLSVACEKQFCSNNNGLELETTVMAAAIRCSPADTWRLLAETLPDVASRKWHYETRNRLGDGFLEALRNDVDLSQRDRLILWCLMVAFCRWFDEGDIKTLSDLHAELLETCHTPAEREEFSHTLQRITPGETQRRSHADDHERHESPHLDEPESAYPIDDALAVIEGGGQLLVSEIAKAICYVTRTDDLRREEIIPRLLAAAGNGEDYAVAWSWGDSFVDTAIASIVRDVSDDHLWTLVRVAQRTNADHRAWMAGTAENLHRVAFARASSRGVVELRNGLATHLSMHSQWAFGGSRWQPPWTIIPEAKDVVTWDQVAVRMLAVLFTSRSAEVLSSAMTGMHALVAVTPESIVPLFQTLRDEWSQHWLLNAAEAWAALHPDALQAVRAKLDEIMHSARLEPRLQAWVVLCSLADIRKEPRPVFPFRPAKAENDTQRWPARGGILETSPTVQGVMRYIDRHSGAKGKLERLSACGFDFSDIENEIASNLLNQPAKVDTLSAFKKASRRDNDLACSGLETEHAVDEAIDRALGSGCSQQRLSRLAQGIFDNEDPWLLRQTPIPTSAPKEWPSEHQLDANVTASNIAGIAKELRHLATVHALPEGWLVAAACVYAATWRDDFAFFTWLEETPGEQHLITAVRRPTCPSGRSFVWWLGDHYEPAPPNDLAVMGYFSGGAQRLCHSFLEIQPSKLWRKFGWRLNEANPLQWMQESDVVAMHQRIHGPPRGSNHGPHNRQPLLHRWIVRADALGVASVNASLAFRLREDFVRVAGEFEK